MSSHGGDDARGDRELVAAACAGTGRKTGSPGNAACRRMLVARLGSVPGCTVRLEPFPLDVWEDARARIVVGGRVDEAVLLDYTGAGGCVAEGPLVWCGRGAARDFRAADVRGCVALVDPRPWSRRSHVVARAGDAGARAVVVASGHEADAPPGSGGPADAPAAVPALCVGRARARELRRLAPAVARVEWEYRARRAEGVNIVVDVAGTGGAPIAVGAHYDSWGCGAQDNGVALWAMLRLARRAAARARGAPYRFVFFDAEELGTAGAGFHASRHDVAAWACYVNLDMIVPTRGRRACAVACSRRMRPAVSFADALAHGYAPVPLEWVCRLLGGPFPSDVARFHERGVPVFTTFCASATNHTARDTLRDVRVGRLGHALRMVEGVLRRVEAGALRTAPPG